MLAESVKGDVFLGQFPCADVLVQGPVLASGQRPQTRELGLAIQRCRKSSVPMAWDRDSWQEGKRKKKDRGKKGKNKKKRGEQEG